MSTFHSEQSFKAIRVPAPLVLVLTLALVAIASQLACGIAWAAEPSPYFVPSGEMADLQGGAAAAPTGDGRVLIVGGVNDGDTITRSAELFSPSLGAFSGLPEGGTTELTVARYAPVAAPLPDGEVLIAGGYDGSTVQYSAELFNPVTDKFTALAASGATELQTAREYAVAAPLASGDVLIAGGANGGPALASAEIFDPSTDTFTALPASGKTQMQAARAYAVAAPLPDGEALIAGGGYPPLASAEIFDPSTDTFTALPASGKTQMQTGRDEAVAAALGNGDVLIAAGENNGTLLQSAELFDPSNDTFTALAASGSTQLQTARRLAVAAPLPGGEALIAGGLAANGYDLLSSELFVPAPQASVSGGGFGDQTVAQPSAEQSLVLTNVGAQTLRIGAIGAVSGSDSGDFAVVGGDCSGRSLAFGQSCAIAVRFTPAAAGPRSATLGLLDNEPTPTAIALTGTGVAADSGPAGPAGPSGGPGPAGAPGPRGSAGQVEIVRCRAVTTGKGKNRKTVQRCSTELTSSPVKFTIAGAKAAAVLSRHGVIYATGASVSSGIRRELLLTPRRRLVKGRYTLTLTRTGGRSRQQVVLG